jgi:hypothetical protein
MMAVAAAAAAACASATAGSGARAVAEPVPAERAPNPPSVSTAVTLKGTFTAILQSTGSVGAANKIRADGSVTVISAGVGNAKTRVRLLINLPLENEQLPWAIAPGNCGNGAIAVTAVSKFGTIDVGSSGRGTLEIDLAVALSPGEQYHVEIYRSGQTLADVMACANLRKA